MYHVEDGDGQYCRGFGDFGGGRSARRLYPKTALLASGNHLNSISF
jgi:hypothetical protein